VQASPGYFETLSVPLVAGRDFKWTDDRRQRDVAVISEGVARALFPGADAVGQRVRLGGTPDRLLEVIGVVADAKLAMPQTRNQLFLLRRCCRSLHGSLNSIRLWCCSSLRCRQAPLRRWRGARSSPLDDTMSSRSTPCNTRWMARCFANA